MDKQAYVQGFRAKCAEMGVDPEKLVKGANFFRESYADDIGSGLREGALQGMGVGASTGAIYGGASAAPFGALAGAFRPVSGSPKVQIAKRVALSVLGLLGGTTAGVLGGSLAGGAVGTTIGAPLGVLKGHFNTERRQRAGKSASANDWVGRGLSLIPGIGGYAEGMVGDRLTGTSRLETIGARGSSGAAISLILGILGAIGTRRPGGALAGASIGSSLGSAIGGSLGARRIE